MAWTERDRKREFQVRLYKLVTNPSPTDRDISVRDVACTLSVPKQTIVDFLVGRSLPTQDQLKSLSVAYGLSVEEFLSAELGSEMLPTENLDPISFELTEIKGTDIGWLWVDKPVSMSVGLKVRALLAMDDPETIDV